MARRPPATDSSVRVTRKHVPPGRGEDGAQITVRVDFGPGGSLGPGKVRLLELIDEIGSIAAAGREMAMSYRRAWMLVRNLNDMFREPLVHKKHGGAGGGSAELTPFGRHVVHHYRSIESAAASVSGRHLRALQGTLAGEAPRSAPDRQGTKDGAVKPARSGS